MSEPAVPLTAYPSVTTPATSHASPSKAFLGHAKLIGFLTLISRFLGLAREMVAGHYLGTGLVASAFTVAFTIPNLFRKLFGEGALSAAFIPLYAQSVKTGDINESQKFAAATVNLLILLLTALTITGEIILFIIAKTIDFQPDRLL